MRKKQPATEFWTVLAVVNVLVLTYPFDLLLRADSVDQHLFASFLLIVSVFLLALADAVSIIVADVVGTGKE